MYMYLENDFLQSLNKKKHNLSRGDQFGQLTLLDPDNLFLFT